MARRREKRTLGRLVKRFGKERLAAAIGVAPSTITTWLRIGVSAAHYESVSVLRNRKRLRKPKSQPTRKERVKLRPSFTLAEESSENGPGVEGRRFYYVIEETYTNKGELAADLPRYETTGRANWHNGYRMVFAFGVEYAIPEGAPISGRGYGRGAVMAGWRIGRTGEVVGTSVAVTQGQIRGVLADAIESLLDDTIIHVKRFSVSIYRPSARMKQFFTKTSKASKTPRKPKGKPKSKAKPKRQAKRKPSRKGKR